MTLEHKADHHLDQNVDEQVADSVVDHSGQQPAVDFPLPANGVWGAHAEQLDCFEADSEECGVVQFLVCHSCVNKLSDEDQKLAHAQPEGEAFYCEIRTESKFPHVPEVLLAWMLCLISVHTSKETSRAWKRTSSWPAAAAIRIIASATSSRTWSLSVVVIE